MPLQPSLIFPEPVFVTRPLLPKLSKVNKKIREIYDAKWLTNFGAMHLELETKLQQFLGVANLDLFNNGTVALEIAIQALGLSGEVITTPFTFAATPHSLQLNGITPVFCDIKPDDFNIDPSKIEALITPKTTAIMAVHVFGNPCDTVAIEAIAAKHNLRVIYDAAHAFAVKVNGVPIGTFGDISMFSFHSTKTYHTIEGGCLTFTDPALRTKLHLLRNFGIRNEEEVLMVGTNGKMNEFQAAFGLLNLEIVEGSIRKRKKVAETYRAGLRAIPGIRFLEDIPGVTHNYSYFPVLVDPALYGQNRDELHRSLQLYNVFSRKYFHPICSHFECYRNLPSAAPENLPVAEKVGSHVLCLPLYADLGIDQATQICKILKYLHNGR
jgi:dTDP-4-amino-4,6-dideoxygalactose transaminase